MRCEACDELMTDLDATAKFEDGRFVGLCGLCRQWLPKSIKIVLRKDLIDAPKDREVNHDAPEDLSDLLGKNAEWED